MNESWSQNLPVELYVVYFKEEEEEDDEIAVLPNSIADSDGPF